MRLGIAAMLLVCAAQAQTLLDQSRLPPSFQSFDRKPGDREVDCSIRQIKPALGFSFRFQAGWVVRVPMKQYSGPRHRWSVVTRITPQGGKPVLLGSLLRLPNVAAGKGDLEVSGSYLVGEGRYQVQWKLVDDSGRVCVADWTMVAKRNRSEAKVRVAMAPGTVSDLSRRSTPREPVAEDVPRFRLTVMFHAAPTARRRIPRMTGRDRITMMGILGSLLERLPTSSVRLVVFNLDRQAELLRLNEAGPDALAQVSQAMNELEIGTVDFQTLANRKGHVDLLADLVNKELAEPVQSDVVLFLGPPARFFDKVPGEAVEKPQNPAAGPGFFYLRYTQIFGGEALFSDTISSAVSRVGGKMTVVRTPGEFAKAIDEVERRGAQHATARLRTR